MNWACGDSPSPSDFNGEPLGDVIEIGIHFDQHRWIAGMDGVGEVAACGGDAAVPQGHYGTRVCEILSSGCAGNSIPCRGRRTDITQICEKGRPAALLFHR